MIYTGSLWTWSFLPLHLLCYWLLQQLVMCHCCTIYIFVGFTLSLLLHLAAAQTLLHHSTTPTPCLHLSPPLPHLAASLTLLQWTSTMPPPLSTTPPSCCQSDTPPVDLHHTSIMPPSRCQSDTLVDLHHTSISLSVWRSSSGPPPYIHHACISLHHSSISPSVRHSSTMPPSLSTTPSSRC